MPLLLDTNGRVKAPARSSLIRSWDADQGVPAGKFTVGRGEAIDTGVTSALSTSGIPRLTITSAAAPSGTTGDRRRAALCGQEFNASDFIAARMHVVFSGAGSNSAPPRMGFASTSGASVGLAVIQQTSGTFAKLYTSGAGGSTNRDIPWRWGPAPIRHDVTLWWSIRDGEFLLAVDDDVIVHDGIYGSALAAGPVYPVIGGQAQAAGLQATIDVYQAELELFYE